MSESSPEQAPQGGYRIALGKTAGERVLGIRGDKSLPAPEKIDEMPIPEGFIMTRKRIMPDGSLALHLASLNYEGVSLGLDAGVMNMADDVAERLEVDKREKEFFDPTVRWVGSGSVFEQQPEQDEPLN